jgi:hypothetical protein
MKVCVWTLRGSVPSCGHYLMESVAESALIIANMVMSWLSPQEGAESASSQESQSSETESSEREVSGTESESSAETKSKSETTEDEETQTETVTTATGITRSSIIARDRVFNDFFLFQYILTYLPDHTSPSPYPLYILKKTFRCLLSIPTKSTVTQFGFSLSLIKWIHKKQNLFKLFTLKNFTKLTSYAPIEVLEWFHEQSLKSKIKIFSPQAHVTAIQYHRLEIIEWLQYKECPFDERTCATAALDSNAIELLTWLRQRPNPYPWRSDTCHNAALVGNLPLLQWLTQQTPPCPLAAGTFSNAAYAGHLNILEWALASDHRPENWNLRLISSAARGGHIHILNWAIRRQHLLWDETALTNAAINGHLHVFHWADTADLLYTWSVDDVTNAAASGGHLPILQYVASKTMTWARRTEVCCHATAGGHLHVLQWLRSLDPPCPWDEEVYRIAQSHHHHKILKWLETQPRPLA